jgi:RNA polymerase sigma-70 factor, ECF subfamily
MQMAGAERATLRESAWGDYLRRCVSRDESALGELYDESSQLVYTIAMRILQDEADASEVVVDVYKQIWDTAARFDEQRASAAAWIVILARSRAMDRRRFRTARMRTAAQIEELSDVISLQPSPESLAIASQNSRSVMRALATVPWEQRQALELSFFAGLSHSEIADRLGEPLGTVKTRIRMAVARLRELLRDAI